MTKNIEDDPEAMLLVVKLYRRGYKGADIRRYMELVEHGALDSTEKRWPDPKEPRWVTK